MSPRRHGHGDGNLKNKGFSLAPTARTVWLKKTKNLIFSLAPSARTGVVPLRVLRGERLLFFNALRKVSD